MAHHGVSNGKLSTVSTGSSTGPAPGEKAPKWALLSGNCRWLWIKQAGSQQRSTTITGAERN
jgi:hypothetical protein